MKKKALRNFGIICLCLVVSILPIIAYVAMFYKHHISDNPEDWGAFGSYIGGIYSILVSFFIIYISRKLTKADEREKKAEQAIEEIHHQVITILNSNFNRNSINKLYRVAAENQLYISESVYNKVINLTDYFLEVNGGGVRDFEKEERTIGLLIEYYNGKVYR